jgi:GWxTD domain-containing protein
MRSPLASALPALRQALAAGVRCAFGVAVLAVPAAAQPAAGAGTAAALMDEGEAALRAGRAGEAVQAFEGALAADPENAEAHFLLARVLFRAGEEARAGRLLARARDLEPENLAYMVAELEQLRTDSWNFFQEMGRLRRRLALARRILALDSANGTAHEELGTYYIRDFLLYRNAAAVPGATFRRAGAFRALIPGAGFAVEEPDEPLPEMSPGQDPAAGLTDEAQDPIDIRPAGALSTPDRFDLATLQGQGAVVQDLSGRADAAYREAVVHLRAALQADARRRTVYDHLMRLAALSGRYADALPMLAQMAAFFPEDPQTWLFLGMAHHRAGQAAEADVAFREALEKMPAAERAAFEDITPFLRPGELAAYRADSAGVALRFWTAQNPRFLTPYNERRLEHYARLTYADLMFGSDDLGLPGRETERGEVHVRYGVPFADVMLVGYQEALEYAEGRLSTFTPTASEQQGNLFNVWDYGDFRLVFEDPLRNGEFRLYSPPADLFAAAGAGAVERNDYVIRARELAREIPERYTYTAPGRTVQLPYRVTAFLGDDGRTDLYVHYGVPLHTSAQPGPDGVVEMPVRTGAFLVDEGRSILAERRRTLYGLRGDQIETFAGARLWTDTQRLRATPGRYTVSLEFETIGGGAAGVQRREIAAPDFSGTRLALSDLMLAYGVEETEASDVPGFVVRNGLMIRPAPWGVFRADRPLFLYFEVYRLGLRDGRTDYEVEARLVPRDEGGGLAGVIRRAFGGGRRGVGTEAEAQGRATDDGQYVMLDAAGQAPGLYILTLRVRDRVTGQEVEKETEVMLE